MFLRQLVLRGFKSFADKTVLEFGPGVSVIVGPNGSGKSNIADAISWVLGEQGARSLRGGQMADVIFAGSPGRKPLGLSEVALVIDNSAGLIQVPATEIEISRTIFRSGESEYRLGGRPCRLLDIQEMLSDAGLGRALHAVVGQGQLDEVLASRAEDRRQAIEEAAGIAKHRRRRERAERKLAGLEQDLLRLQDVVGELRRQLKPLEKQAELAARHEALTQEADDLSMRIAAARLRELYLERDRRRPTWLDAERRQTEARGQLEALDADLSGLEEQRAESEAEEILAEGAHGKAQREKSAADAELRGALRREADARERLAAATNGAGRLFALEEELRRTERALAEVLPALEARGSELLEAEERFRRLDQERGQVEAERRRMEEAAGGLRAETETLRRSLAHEEAEQDRLARTVGELDLRIHRWTARSQELDAEIERLDGLTTPFAQEHATLERERSALVGTLAGLETAEHGLLARQEVLEQRRDELAESPGAAFAKRRGDKPIGVLRQLIEAPPNLEVALRSALGQFADAVVYPTTEDVLAEALAADGGNGLVLAVADGSAPRFSIPGERCLLDMVTPDPRVGGLAGSLLANAYLVNNLAEAAAKHRRYPHAFFVTTGGVVLGPTFVRTPARTEARTEGVRRDIAAIERELSGVRRGLREGRSRLQEVDGRLEALRAQLAGADREITAAAEEMSSCRADLAALLREKEVVAERLRAVLASTNSTRARLAAGPAPSSADLPALPPRPEPPVQLRVEVEALRRELGRLDAGVVRTRRDLEGPRADDPGSLREALERAQAERGALEERTARAEAELAEVQDAYRAATERARRSRERHVDVNRAWREQAAEVERLRSGFEEQHRLRADLDGRVADAERILREGHGAEPDAAVAGLARDDTVESMKRRAETVQRRLALVGKVNLLAAGELTSLRERHDFIVRELQDVRTARRDLEDVIGEVDRQMTELFSNAFADVAREFERLFALLFPGGEGRLFLTDPADPLGSGVEVEARPGRKRVKRLSLLSGGERSLTALAFLFAIFVARPSPFYLMDEVEAALDDVNLHRFLDVVGDLAERSQVLLVTHQKRTMEMADVLYGVSMGSDGTSTVISQRLAGAPPADQERSEQQLEREASTPR